MVLFLLVNNILQAGQDVRSVYGVQTRAGDSLSKIAKALRTQGNLLTSNTRIECRVFREVGGTELISVA